MLIKTAAIIGEVSFPLKGDGQRSVLSYKIVKHGIEQDGLIYFIYDILKMNNWNNFFFELYIIPLKSFENIQKKIKFRWIQTLARRLIMVGSRRGAAGHLHASLVNKSEVLVKCEATI